MLEKVNVQILEPTNLIANWSQPSEGSPFDKFIDKFGKIALFYSQKDSLVGVFANDGGFDDNKMAVISNSALFELSSNSLLITIEKVEIEFKSLIRTEKLS